MPARARTSTQAITWQNAALSLLAAVLVWRLLVYLFVAVQAIGFRYGIDYGEGIVLQQTYDMLGPRAYGPIDHYPAIVYHYPPVYHLIVRGWAALTNWDMLAAGRAVSVVATLICAALVGQLSRLCLKPGTGPWAVLLGTGGAALIFITFMPVSRWSSLMRVDMVALAAGLGGLVCGLAAYRDRRWIYAASLLLVLAVFTKQTALFTPVAFFLPLFWLRPDLAARGVGACVLLSAAGFAVANHVTDGGFFRHVVLYNMNRIDLTRMSIVGGQIAAHAGFVLIAWLGLREIFADTGEKRLFGDQATIPASPRSTAIVHILCYAFVSTLALALIVKVGSNRNYMLEWCAATAILGGVGLAMLTEAPSPKMAALVPMLVAANAYAVSPVQMAKKWAPDRTAALNDLEKMVRGTARPVISDEMVAQIRGGQRVDYESAIFAELGAHGLWNERDFIRRIDATEFSMFVTKGGPGHRQFDLRHNPAVVAAMQRRYQQQTVLGEFIIWQPATPVTGSAAGRGY